jgi:hypothetical protein
MMTRSCCLLLRDVLVPLGMVWLGLVVGCQNTPKAAGRFADRLRTNRSVVTWNYRTALGVPSSTASPRAVELLTQPRRQLDGWLESCPAPTPATLHGQWRGINRGIGISLTGVGQFIKDFDTQATGCDAVIGRGSNILVEQVPIEQLGCRGWQPRIDQQTGDFQRRGDFAIVAREATVLDYSMGSNPGWDPARWLVDELVQVDADLLLGRAYLQWGRLRVPVSYFTLQRMPAISAACLEQTAGTAAAPPKAGESLPIGLEAKASYQAVSRKVSASSLGP